MASVMRMPGVSADAEEAALVEWSVAVGASLSGGDVIAVVETEKANVDIPVDSDATLWRTLAEPGESVGVGSPIAVLLAEGEGDAEGEALLASLGLGGAAGPPAAPAASAPEGGHAPEPTDADPAAPTIAAAAAPHVAAEPASPVDEAAGRIAASPLVRRLARDAGIPLDALTGTGPRGRIVRADLERALREDTAQAPPIEQSAQSAQHAVASLPREAGRGPAEEIPHSRLRRAIANTLTSSKRNAPHFYLTATARVDALLEVRARINAVTGTRVSINDLVIKAAARAFAAVPEVNVIWTDDAVHRFETVDIAVAIGSPRGLVTPVLREVERSSVSEISARVKDFAARADEGRLKQDELTGGVFTISNLGMYGVEEFSAIINPPHVGILAVGAAVKRPVVVDDEIVVGTTITVTASFDHRPVDGVLGARWLAALIEALENPLAILA